MQVHEDEELSEEEETLAEDTVALEKQLAWSEHRMRELESLVESAVSPNLASACSPACPPGYHLRERQGQTLHVSTSIVPLPKTLSAILIPDGIPIPCIF